MISVKILKKYSIYKVLQKGLWELFLLKASGLGRNIQVNGVSWYLSALIIDSFILFYILCKKWRGVNCVVLPVVYLCVMGNFYSLGHLNWWMQELPIMTYGCWRGFVEMGLGCTAYFLYCEYFENNAPNVSCGLSCVLKLIETMLIAGVLVQLAKGKNAGDFLVPVMAAIILILSFCGFSFWSKIFSSNGCFYLGRLSYAVYLNQFIVIKPFIELYPGYDFYLMAIIMLILVVLLSVFSMWIVDCATRILIQYINDK